MRKIVLIITGLLVVSGVLLVAMGPETGDGAGGHPRIWTSLFHIWGGVLYLVLFTLFGWDHISANRRWLRIPSMITLTGLIQTFSAVVIILSGVVILLYGNQVWPTLRGFHHWLTYLLSASILLHIFSRRRRKIRADREADR